MEPPKWHQSRSGLLAIVIGVGLLVVLLIAGKGELLWRALGRLYSPFAAFVAVVMLVEYIILKGADRSALYRRELDAARLKRREDLLMMRRVEGQLVEMEARLKAAANGAEPSGNDRQAIRDIREMLDRIRSQV